MIQTADVRPCCLSAHDTPVGIDGAVVCAVLAQLYTGNVEWIRIFRSREVKQSWISTVPSTLLALIQSVAVVARVQPELILSNGPGRVCARRSIVPDMCLCEGTCVPLCYAGFLLRVLGISYPAIIFCESLCRVKTLSLSGKLLYPIADRFIVQWPQLAEWYL
jgi:beta-1,4-N-acetylglucosaminyltransferase